jgi:hypothetical protein
MLRPGNARANTAADHKTVLDFALVQVPSEYIEMVEILVRAVGWPDCREGNLRFSVGYELTEAARAAILQIPEDAWVAALDQDGSVRTNREVAEVADSVDLSSWPRGIPADRAARAPAPWRAIVVHHHDGRRFQAILTDQDDDDIAVLECRHRQHAHVEDRICDDKDIGLRKFPFKQFALNEVWLEIIMLAHDLIV